MTAESTQASVSPKMKSAIATAKQQCKAALYESLMLYPETFSRIEWHYNLHLIMPGHNRVWAGNIHYLGVRK